MSKSCGSSPRARGTGRRPGPACRRRRFIPACAGNGSRARCSAARSPVHPRVRGERAGNGRPGRSRRGSSPRARGTVYDHAEFAGGGRFIPACAGNGYKTIAVDLLIPVHPRVRGERDRDTKSKVAPNGSSPRARGTGLRWEEAVGLLRFIPACAGNGPIRWMALGMNPVHPRVRGERAVQQQATAIDGGSSPRARGTV